MSGYSQSCGVLGKRLIKSPSGFTKKKALDRAMKYFFCNAREATCPIHLFMYEVNSLGAGWIGPHTTYSHYFTFYVGVVNLCLPRL
jgi:hypothetical protein